MVTSSTAGVLPGGALGTPSSGVLTNCTGLPISGIIGYQGYALNFSSAALNPADATTYYFGLALNTVSTTAAESSLIIPKAGTVKRVDIIYTNQGTAGTTETSTVSFRLNNTTDTTISAAVVTNAVRQAVSNTGLSIAVAAGDTFEIKWVTPTYATNPTVLRIHGIIYIE